MTHRLRWGDLPGEVRSRVENLLGSPVTTTRSAPGGFSPSTAEIVTGEDGRRVFVKAVTPSVNSGSDALNRREAAILSPLPRSVPAAALLESFTWGDWFVLVIEAADGKIPHQPWRPAQLDSVLSALHALQKAATPSPLIRIPALEESLGPDLRGFDRVAADPPPDLDPWLRERLGPLRDAAVRGIEAIAGDTLCHSDLRADNILVNGRGTVVFVDWAWASRGSRFADALQLLSSVEDPDGGLDVSGRIDTVMDTHDTPVEIATDVLIGILGFFVDASRWPVEPTLPTLAEHRCRRRDALLPVVRERWDQERRG